MSPVQEELDRLVTSLVESRSYCEECGGEKVTTVEVTRGLAYGDAPEPDWRLERCERCGGTGYEPEKEE